MGDVAVRERLPRGDRAHHLVDAAARTARRRRARAATSARSSASPRSDASDRVDRVLDRRRWRELVGIVEAGAHTGTGVVDARASGSWRPTITSSSHAIAQRPIGVSKSVNAVMPAARAGCRCSSAMRLSPTRSSLPVALVGISSRNTTSSGALYPTRARANSISSWLDGRVGTVLDRHVRRARPHRAPRRGCRRHRRARPRGGRPARPPPPSG